MPTSSRARTRTTRYQVLALSAAAGFAAALAPTSLTGQPAVDAVERAVVAGGVTYVGANGRRMAWIVAGGLVAASARGGALVLALAALAVLAGSAVPERRNRVAGAVGIALLTNASFWATDASPGYARALVPLALAIILGSGLRQLRRVERRVAKAALALVVVVVAIGGAGAAAAVARAQSSVTRGTTAADHALTAARNGDTAGARSQLGVARSDFATASARLSGVSVVATRVVPGLAQQLRAVQVAVHEGSRIAASGDELAASADYQKLRYAGHIDVGQVQKLAAPTSRTAAVLEQATDHLDRARRGLLLPPLRDKLDDFAAKLADARRDATVAASLLHRTPGLLGGDGTRRYLVVFTTPAELRGAGGFIGSYAELTATDGRVRLTRSGRIAELIDAVPMGTRHLSGPKDYLARYGSFHPEDYLQDATFSPDFPSDADVLSQLYPQSGGSPVDGVISVDPRGLAALLKITGPVVVPGLPTKLSAANAESVLLRDQYQLLPGESERGDILTAATRITFDRLTRASLPAPRTLADALSPAARTGHLRMWSPDAGEESLFRSLGADGSLVVPKGSDGFSVVQQNNGNNKIDAYLHRTVRYRAQVNAHTGDVVATLEVDLRNEVPSLSLPNAVVANTRAAPRGTNLAHLTIYSPLALTGATIDGTDVQLAPSRELGLHAYDTPVLQIPPGGVTKVVVHLAGGVDLRHGYQLRILPQPLANPDRVTATITVQRGTVSATGRRTATIVEDHKVTRRTTRRVAISG